MAWEAIANTVPQYDNLGVPASGYVLKAYKAGTTTNISLATDSTGGTTASDIVLNSKGYPEVSGSIIIPHVNQTFKLALYATQAAADADTGAVWTFDNLSPIVTKDISFQVYTTDIASDNSTPNSYTTTWYDSNKIADSGATWTSTGTTTGGNAGLGLHTDGYVYNANGDQYQIDGDIAPEKFGADRTADSTAITRAITASGPDADGRYKPVRLSGDYYCNEIAWNNQTSLIGTEVGNARLLYDGAGGAGTTVIKNATTGGATPWAGFKNLTILGWNATTNTIAEHCYDLTGTTGTDWGAKFENLALGNCYGDAIELSNSLIINLHMNRLRFDSVGGFCLSLKADATSEQRPVTLTQFTVDNNITGAFATKATSDGHYNGTNWGKGILKAVDTKGLNMTFRDARIELNKNLITHNVRRCMFYVDQTLAGGETQVILESIYGYFQNSDGGAVVFANSGRTSCKFENVNVTATNVYFEDNSNNVLRHKHTGNFVYKNNEQQDQGFGVQDHQVEYRDGVPGGTVVNRYRRGDIIFDKTSSAGSPNAWVVVSPTVGYSSPDNASLTTTAVVTASSANITISTAADLRDLQVYTAVTVVGAGVAAADLDTYITAVNPDTAVITVNDTPSTSVNPATIKIQVPVFRTWGGMIGSDQLLTFTDGDTTPTVSGGTLFKTANTGATTISDFDNGTVGKRIKVIIGDTNTTIDFTGSGLKGNQGANWSPTTDDHMDCEYDGTDWFCAISDNTA